jgi:uncharacterized membrane protein SpoIIM required for sporulation
VIVDLDRFIAQERPRWQEMETMLSVYDRDRLFRPTTAQSVRLFELYQRSLADLARLEEGGHRDIANELSSLVSRAYAQIHSSRRRPRFEPLKWLLVTLPVTFRRQVAAFQLSLAITLFGCALGAGFVAWDTGSKEGILPFKNLLGDPKQRVYDEEHKTNDATADVHAPFAAMLMTHNTRVALFALASGLTWGIGTMIILFANGVTLGAVCFDYIRVGETRFLLGWLMPHGVIEIPAILVASQAGLVLASALIGWNKRIRRRDRLRAVSGDVFTLALGAALMLVWAGIVESYISQYHKPVLPYEAKIAFGAVELVLLIYFYFFVGRHSERGKSREPSIK